MTALITYEDEDLKKAIIEQEGGFSQSPISGKKVGKPHTTYRPYNQDTKTFHAYPDAKGIWTIAHGHTGPEVVEGYTLSEEEGMEILNRDITNSINEVDKFSSERKENAIHLQDQDIRIQRMLVYYGFKMDNKKFVDKYKDLFLALNTKNWNLLRQNYRIGHYDAKGNYKEHTKVTNWVKENVINPVINEQPRVVKQLVPDELTQQLGFSEPLPDPEISGDVGINATATYRKNNMDIDYDYEDIENSYSQPLNIRPQLKTPFKQLVWDHWNQSVLAAWWNTNKSLTEDGTYDDKVDPNFDAIDWLLAQEPHIQTKYLPFAENFATAPNLHHLQNTLNWIDEKQKGIERMGNEGFWKNLGAGLTSMLYSENLLYAIPVVMSSPLSVPASIVRGSAIMGGIETTIQVGASQLDPSFTTKQAVSQVGYAMAFGALIGVGGYGWRYRRQVKYGIPINTPHKEAVQLVGIHKEINKITGKQNVDEGFMGFNLYHKPEVRFVPGTVKQKNKYAELDIKNGEIQHIIVDVNKIRSNWKNKPWREFGLKDKDIGKGEEGIAAFTHWISSYTYAQRIVKGTKIKKDPAKKKEWRVESLWKHNEKKIKKNAIKDRNVITDFVPRPTTKTFSPIKDIKLTPEEFANPIVKKFLDLSIKVQLTRIISTNYHKTNKKFIKELREAGGDFISLDTKDWFVWDKQLIKDWLDARRALAKAFPTFTQKRKIGIPGVKSITQPLTKKDETSMKFLPTRIWRNVQKKFPQPRTPVKSINLKIGDRDFNSSVKITYDKIDEKVIKELGLTKQQSIAFANDELLTWRNMNKMGDTVLTKEGAETLTKKHGKGIFDYKKYAEGVEAGHIMKLLGMPHYAAMRIARKHFGKDNLLQATPWELWNQGGLIHAGVDVGVGKPISIGNRIFREVLKKRYAIAVIIDKAYAKSLGYSGKRILTLDPATLKSMLPGKARQLLQGKQVLFSGNKTEFAEELGKVYINWSKTKGFPTKNPHMKEAAEAIRKEFKIIEGDLIKYGLLPTSKNIRRTKIRLQTLLQKKQMAYNAMIDSHKKYYKGTPKELKGTVKEAEKEINLLKKEIKETDELLYQINHPEFFQAKFNITEPYFPRIWNKEAIEENLDELKGILRQWLKKNPFITKWDAKTGKVIKQKTYDTSKSLEDKIEDIIRNIRQEADYLDPDGFMTKIFNKQKGFRHFYTRQLDIPNRLVGKFIMTDLNAVPTSYFTRVIPQLKIAETFGDRFMNARLLQLSEHMDQTYIKPLISKLEKTKSLKEQTRLKTKLTARYKAKKEYLEQISLLKDQIQGTIFSANPARWDSRTALLAKNLASLAYMGSVVKTAVIDQGTVVLAQGLGNTWRGIATSLHAIARQNNKPNGAAGFKDGVRTGELFDMAISTLLRRFVETGELSGRASKLEKLVNNAQQPFYMLNLLTPWTTALKSIASSAATVRISHNVLQWAADQGHKGAIKKLAEIGLTKTTPGIKTFLTKKLTAHGKYLDPDDKIFLLSAGIDKKMALKIADMPLYKEGRNYVLNLDGWKDAKLANQVETILGNEINRSVLMPRGPDRSFLFDGVIRIPWIRKGRIGKKKLQSKWFSFPTQFLSYGWNATQTISMRAMQNPDGYVLSGLLALYSLGWFSASWKDKYWAYKSPTEKSIRAFELGGILGLVNDLNIKFETVTKSLRDSGLFGYDFPEIGYRPLARKMGLEADYLWGEPGIEDIAGEFAGAAPGMAIDVINAFTGEHTLSEKVHMFRRMIPYNNVIWWNGILRDFTSGATEFYEERR
ncbi:putative internal virion protein D [uncultured Mediterranean phage uvDeep-CGR2-KM21-C368]|nr:putative internal virion protein D [uncultured Mediterranean phage uvDeep-CGR2-KM21-C368]